MPSPRMVLNNVRCFRAGLDLLQNSQKVMHVFHYISIHHKASSHVNSQAD